MNRPRPYVRPLATTLAALAGLATLLALVTEPARAATAPVPPAVAFQGRISVNGVPFTGSGRFLFWLIDGSTETIVFELSPPEAVGQAPVNLPVDRGLYSVHFGIETKPIPTQILETYPDLRLQIAFDDGVHGFQNLTPAQPIVSVPFARRAESTVRAESASSLDGTVAAAQIVGTLPDNRLPPSLARLDSSPSFTGTVSASGYRGAGALPWSIVTASEWLMEPNHGYIADRSDSAVLFMLPTTADPGDIIRVVGQGAAGWGVSDSAGNDFGLEAAGSTWIQRQSPREWKAIACSADGNRIMAALANGPLYRSADSGVSWAAVGPVANWTSLAASADGSKWVGGSQGGRIYTSTDFGDTWVPRDSARSWTSVASSADGTKLVACVGNGAIYTSTDSGQTWTPRTANRPWMSVAGSADGSRLVTVDPASSVFTSADGGVTWVARNVGVNNLYAVASSADGRRLVAVGKGNSAGQSIFTSADGGVSWASHRVTPGSGDEWLSVTCSADGRRLAAFNQATVSIYTSTDYGETWARRTSDHQFVGLASSAAGDKLVAATDREYLYTSASRSIRDRFDLTEFRFDGNGVWTPSSFALLDGAGTIPLWQLPNIPADKFADIDASKITSGTIAAARLPLLDASILNTGVLDLRRIPDLPASKITSGVFPEWLVPSGLTGPRYFSGKVGFGFDTQPVAPISVRSSGFDFMALRTDTGSGRWILGTDFDASFVLHADTRTYDLVLRRDTGNLGIGLDNPDSPLSIRPNAANGLFGYCIALTDRSKNPMWKLGVDNSAVFSIGAAGLRDYDLAINRTTGNVGLGGVPFGGSTKLRVAGDLSVSGSGFAAGGFHTASDRRLKTAIAPLDRALSRVRNLRGVSFQWRTDIADAPRQPGPQLGFLAQELAPVAPELVRTNVDGLLAVQYDGVIPMLVEAVKELERGFESRLAEKDRELEFVRARLERLETVPRDPGGNF